MKKMVSVFLALAMILAAFSAASADPVALKYNDWSAVDESWSDCYDALFAQFDEKFASEIDLDVGGNAYADTLNQLLIQAGGKNPPDIAKIKTEWLPQFLAMDALTDLTPYIPEDMLSDFYEGALNSYGYNGGIYALPYFSQGYAVFYNKDLLAKAGITELPKTFDELIADAYKISALGQDESGNKIYGLAMPGSGTQNAEGYNVFPWLWANGGDFKNADGEIVLYSEQNLKSFSEIQQLYVNNVSPLGLTFNECRNLFGTGDLGFYWDLMSQTSSFVKSSVLGTEYLDHIGAFVIPSNGPEAGVGYNTESIFVVFKQCKDPAAAVKVINYLSGIEGQSILAEYGKGKMSTRASVMDSLYSNVTDEITMAYIEAMASNHALPFADQYFMEADLAIGRSLTRLAMNEDVDTVLKELQEEVTEIYAGNV